MQFNFILWSICSLEIIIKNHLNQNKSPQVQNPRLQNRPCCMMSCQTFKKLFSGFDYVPLRRPHNMYSLQTDGYATCAS